MADKRQDLIDEVITQLKTVADFNDNVGDFELNWQQDELPAISVFDNETKHQFAFDEPEADAQLNTLTLTIQIFVASDTRAADLRDLIKKVRTVLAANRYWNDLAAWTKPVSTSMMVENSRRDGLTNNSFEIIGASIELEITLTSDAFDF